jgi:hypothetical protein
MFSALPTPKNSGVAAPENSGAALIAKTTACTVLAASMAVMCGPARAAEDTERGTFSILIENDAFFNADHDYTNGLELAYTTAPQDTPQWAVRAANWLPLFRRITDRCA